MTRKPPRKLPLDRVIAEGEMARVDLARNLARVSFAGARDLSRRVVMRLGAAGVGAFSAELRRLLMAKTTGSQKTDAGTTTDKSPLALEPTATPSPRPPATIAGWGHLRYVKRTPVSAGTGLGLIAGSIGLLPCMLWLIFELGRFISFN